MFNPKRFCAAVALATIGGLLIMKAFSIGTEAFFR